MNYFLKYSPRALADVKNILDYLAEIHPDLPRRFRSNMADMFEELDQFPERRAPNKNGIRAASLRLSKRLSYHLFYQLEEPSTIWVLRIIPQSANPAKWPK